MTSHQALRIPFSAGGIIGTAVVASALFPQRIRRRRKRIPAERLEDSPERTGRDVDQNRFVAGTLIVEGKPLPDFGNAQPDDRISYSCRSPAVSRTGLHRYSVP